MNPAPVRLVLASASPARAQLLRSAGIEADTVVSGVDETSIGALDVADLTCALAQAKARAVAAGRTDGALVLGCDSLLELDGTAYGKPADADDVRRRWRAMAGRSGALRTGHCLIDTRTGAEHSGVASTTVFFGTPSAVEIDAYAASGEPTRVAGGFTLDGYGGWFIDRIDGDHGTVLGLSLPVLREFLARCGLSPADLWPAVPGAAAPCGSPGGSDRSRA